MIKLTIEKVLNNIPANIDIIDCSPNEINQLMKYFDKLSSISVPKNGKANTIGGECIRAMQRVLYRAINDGDMIGNLQNFGYTESAIGYIYNILENYYGVGTAKQFHFAEASFLDVLEDIKRVEHSTNKKEAFEKHYKTTMNDYIYQIKCAAIDLMFIFKEDDFIFNMINKNDNYQSIPIEEFIHAMYENYSVGKDEIINAWNKYVSFRKLL